MAGLFVLPWAGSEWLKTEPATLAAVEEETDWTLANATKIEEPEVDWTTA